MRYAELFCRTHYSFLRGASHPHELVERAAELGLSALAITDIDGVYAIPKAYVASKSFPGLKLITGSEITLNGLPPVNLLAMDRAGYGLLCRIITASRADKPKGESGVDWSVFLSLLERPGGGCGGLIAIPRLLDPAVLASLDPQELEDYLGTLKERFGARLRLPVARFLDGHDSERVGRVVELSKRFGVPLIATNDVHMHCADRRKLQDALSAVRENRSLDETGRALFSNAERHAKSARQMAELFRDFPEALGAIEESARIADLCAFSPKELRYRYPSEWIPQGYTAESYLSELTWKGAAGRYPGGIPGDVRAQLEHELKLILELEFSDYFLTIWEVVEFARSRKILCQGRGSAANSAVCYCLGITAVDPVRMNLLFERFISAERGEPPDIDVDFEHERREEVIQHIYEKYGRERAGMVAVNITYRTKSAVRDLMKALPRENEDQETRDSLMEELLGFPRHLSIHPGGFTLSADPIIETVPIEPARMEGRTVVQWDKDDLAVIGLLKVDILALGMLTAIRKAMDLVKDHRGKALALATIPAEDRATYQMICKADTVGVFQIESRAQMSMLPRLLPKTFYDLVIEVAIVRPGPIVGQMVHPYLRRRRGLEPSASPDPKLEPILGRTLGVPLFQEQVMKMAIVMAGFTPGEADELRRAIGAWRSSGSIEKMGKKLMKGLLDSGLPREFVDRIFLQIQGFAEYGFPESHAASFALLAYASSYLKCHYPAEFACALINSQPMGFYSVHTIVEDARRHGVKILPLDPNISDWDCRIENEKLRVGWRVVRGLGEQAAREVLEERGKNGDFRSLADFIARTRLRPDVLTNLAMGDAFACFGLRQREALWDMLACQRNSESDEQMELFQVRGAPLGFASLDSREPQRGPEERAQFVPLTEYQALQADFQSTGLSARRGHPMGPIRKVLKRRIPPTTTQTARQALSGRSVRLAGLVIVRQRPPTAKGTVFATLEDESGFLDLIVHKETFDRFEEIFVENPFLVVGGRIQRDGDLVNMIVGRVEKVDLSQLGNLTVSSRDFH